jgi:hypothetical protein
MEGVKMGLRSQAADFYDTHKKCTPPYDNCHNSGGDYVQKYLKYVMYLFCKLYFLSHCLFC